MKNLIFQLYKKPEFVIEELSKYARVRQDHNGNIIGEMGNLNAKRHIMLDAHADKIGFIVTSIKDGFIKIAPCGGVDPKIMPGACVVIHGEKDIKGIVCSVPPHLIKDKDNVPKIEDLFIDTGISKKMADSLISVGDYVSFYSEPKALLNGKISAAYLDNKAGVAVLLRCAKFLSKLDLNYKVTIVMSSQEETTGCGAKTASYQVNPDESIVVDVSFASQPGVPEDKCGSLSKGPMIGVSPALFSGMYSELIKIAKKEKIPYQIEPMGGKTYTNADHVSVSKKGVQTCLISIPLRYMHTPVEVIDVSDIKNTVKLIVSYINRGGIDG